jgi:hypothetical protein
MKTKLSHYTLAGFLLATVGIAQAQSVTYNHDETKRQQILVMETGGGSLTPAAYYTLFHSTYAKSAASTNKLTYRSAAAASAYLQVPDAEALDSALQARAKIEALNVADRSGGALDVAWTAEGGKVNNRLEQFLKNIERILPAGGTVDQRDRWMEYYRMFQSAVTATRQAYMPNAQRKKEYLRIYADIGTQNEILLGYLVQLGTQSKTRTLLAATMTRTDHKADHIREAKARWKGGAGQQQSIEEDE